MVYVPVNRNALAHDLREHVAEVIFDKVDGTRRVMRCTLRRDYIPEGTDLSSHTASDVLNVWDVENNGWRAFHLDRVISMQIMQGYS